VRFTLTRVQRTVLVLAATAAASFSPIFVRTTANPGDPVPSFPWTAFVVGLAVALAAVAVAVPYVEVRERELVVRWWRRRRVIPWADVIAIRPEQVGGLPRVVVCTVDGQFLLPVPALGDSSFDERSGVVAAAFAASGAAGQGFRPLRPWGGALAGGGEVVVCADGISPWLAVPSATMAASALWRWAFLSPLALVVVVALVAVAALAAHRWPRALVTASGLELRGWTRRFVPWSAVGSILVTVPRPWSRYNPGSERARLITTLGAFDVPGLVRAHVGSDPEFDRKVDFLRRSWVAWRGPAWVGPPPPPHADLGRTTE
jgi:hypothetical protein